MYSTVYIHAIYDLPGESTVVYIHNIEWWTGFVELIGTLDVSSRCCVEVTTKVADKIAMQASHRPLANRVHQR